MSKKVQLLLSNEAWEIVESVFKDANQGFELGRITYTDVINDLVMSSKADVKALQLKHTSVKKSLLMLSNQKGIDFDTALKAISDLRAKVAKKQARNQHDQEVQV